MIEANDIRVIRIPDQGASSMRFVVASRCKVLSFKARVDTSGTVGDRFYVMTITDKSGELKLVIGLPSTFPAAANTYVSLAPGLGSTYGAVVHHQSIPHETVLEVDDVVEFVDSQDISTNDRVSAAVLVAELLEA